MHPYIHARNRPDHPAQIIYETGETLTYGELDRRSNQGAHLFRSLGLQAGDTISIFLENHPRYMEIAWAAQRSGLYFVCVSSKLTAAEAEYIVRDSDSKLVVTSGSVGPEGPALAALLPDLAVFAVGDGVAGARSWEAEAGAQPDTPIADERGGTDMLYSSGTTGRPKGIRGELPDATDIAAETTIMRVSRDLYGVSQDSIYICPAPLYHSAPLRFCMMIQRFGGTIVIMQKFDPEKALELIERYKVNVSQWVPTHFIRMLKLPEDVRAKYDLSSLKVAVHAAAPCPVPVKQAMIDWWGPILFEYYAGTEGNGMTMIRSEEWLKKPGSVGRAVLGTIRICGEDGEPLPAGQEGVIYIEGGAPFEYYNDPAKTAESTNKYGWTTLGDVGRLDEDGYLFLTDRKSFMIISGGVNIYPQEIENLLVTHPRVADVAVVGAPDPEMGEQVVAVIQPLDWADATPDFAAELAGWAREHLSGVKTPRRFDFMAELPRHPTGKLYKRLIRDSYWGKENSRIV
ncbi:MAG: acyl-CoA synthetase [Sphingobium sp.]